MDFEWALYTGIVDQAVDLGVLGENLLGECRDVFDVACVKNVVRCVGELLGCFNELRLGTTDEDDLLVLGEKVLCHGITEATSTAGDDGAFKIEDLTHVC